MSLAPATGDARQSFIDRVIAGIPLLSASNDSRSPIDRPWRLVFMLGFALGAEYGNM